MNSVSSSISFFRFDLQLFPISLCDDSGRLPSWLLHLRMGGRESHPYSGLPVQWWTLQLWHFLHLDAQRTVFARRKIKGDYVIAQYGDGCEGPRVISPLRSVSLPFSKRGRGFDGGKHLFCRFMCIADSPQLFIAASSERPRNVVGLKVPTDDWMLL